jgi:hypothetical protein
MAAGKGKGLQTRRTPESRLMLLVDKGGRANHLGK